MAKNCQKCRFVKMRMLTTLWKTKANDTSRIKRKVFYPLKKIKDMVIKKVLYELTDYGHPMKVKIKDI